MPAAPSGRRSSRGPRPARRPPTTRGAGQAPEALPPAKPLRQRVGHAGEIAALAYLKQEGFTILATDWRCRVGQIDIVGEEDGTLVLVEVKARRNRNNGMPQESVDGRKQHKLRMLLELYRAATRRQKQPCRIDVLALMLDDGLRVRSCEHIRDAVQDV